MILVVVRLFDLTDDPVSERHRVRVLLGMPHDHDELVATEASDEVSRADVLGESATDLGEHTVAGEMPLRVVDRLEAVEVDEQHRNGFVPVGGGEFVEDGEPIR